MRALLFGVFLLASFFIHQFALSQDLTFHKKSGLFIRDVQFPSGKMMLDHGVDLFSVDIDNLRYSSADAEISRNKDRWEFSFGNGIEGYLLEDKDFDQGWKAHLRFSNNSMDTIEISNVVPFGASDEHIYITATGPWSLTRTKIFRPGKEPVGVILPDNAWEMGYASVETQNVFSLCAIARRTNWEDAKRHRYKTVLYPGTFVEYTIYIESYQGEWQNGLRKMFQKNYLFDLREFDNSLFEREDLSWIKDEYLMILQFAWDHKFFDWKENEYNFKSFLQEGEKYFGGYDVFGIWPTWPALGMDKRNQWDLYGDLPGGLDKLKELSHYAQEHDTKFFIAYNPWDKSTRQENPYKGMARLIEATDANGVVLDTRGSSSYELQNAADSVKSGVVMYSEGMAVPKDMPGIISGRVHDAIYMPPVLNLNKLIKPDFAIFRVCQLSQGRIHREAGISFFNGYGNELNTFAPGRPEWMEEEFIFLGDITRMLRENSSAFHSYQWTPLIPTLHDSIWVNQWPTESKDIYTVFSLVPQGFDDVLFEAETGKHYVSLYHHEELRPDTINGKLQIPVKTHAFDKAWLDTRREGNVDCIAAFDELLEVELSYDTLKLDVKSGSFADSSRSSYRAESRYAKSGYTKTEIRIWAGNPSYQKEAVILPVGSHELKLYDLFDRYEGKFVVQLLKENEILDERVVYIEPGTPRLISTVQKTAPAEKKPDGMIYIPGGEYIFSVKSEKGFIPYPDDNKSRKINVESFYMDEYPVTNAQYYNFIQQSSYKPEDTSNYLKHWSNGKYSEGEADYPVVNIGLKDARAYAAWAGKRLPTEIEWQYAAQGGNSEQSWPWGNEFDTTKCNTALDHLTPVNAFPAGASKHGVKDMVGNLWQMTNDVYDNGSYYFNILKGGSHYKPTASWWYVQGGPMPVNENQMLLLVSPSFNRNETVGFRCVVDE